MNFASIDSLQAALCEKNYVDDFLPVHDLASLEDLANRLVDLDSH